MSFAKLKYRMMELCLSSASLYGDMRDVYAAGIAEQAGWDETGLCREGRQRPSTSISEQSMAIIAVELPYEVLTKEIARPKQPHA